MKKYPSTLLAALNTCSQDEGEKGPAMNTPSKLPRSHLFTVRVWQEELGEGQSEWRGQVRLVTGEDVRYFRQWSALVPLLITMLAEAPADTDSPV